jgi:hypothetical protein
MPSVIQRPSRSALFLSTMLSFVAAGVVAISAVAPRAGLAALPAVQTEEVRCEAPAPVSFPVALAATASPVARPAASPASGETVPGAAAIERVVRIVAVCQTESRVKTLTRFVTENFLGDLYAGGGEITKEQFAELAKDLPNAPVAVVSVDDVEFDAETERARAVVVWTVGNQLLRARWSFLFVRVPSPDGTSPEASFGVWQPDGVTSLSVRPPEGARTVEITLRDHEYDPGRLRVRGPDIVISAQNRGREDHELLVLLLRHDRITADLLTAPGPALPNGVTVLGQLTVAAGAEGTLVLVGVEPGEYVIVDLLPGSDGSPHLARGMEAILTVR